MHISYQHKRRRELFPMWNDFTHAPRPITVNKAFHVCSRVESVQFPTSPVIWERRMFSGVYSLAQACRRGWKRWLQSHYAASALPGRSTTGAGRVL